MPYNFEPECAQEELLWHASESENKRDSETDTEASHVIVCIDVISVCSTSALSHWRKLVANMITGLVSSLENSDCITRHSSCLFIVLKPAVLEVVFMQLLACTITRGHAPVA